MSEVRLVVAILVPAIFTLILKDFFDLFMTNRYEGKVKQYTIWMLYFLLDTVISMNFKFVGVISMLYSFIILIAFCAVLYRDDIKYITLTVLFIICIGAASELIVALGIRAFLNSSQLQQFSLFGSTCSKLIILIIVRIVKLFRVSGIKRLDYMNWLANVSMTAGSLWNSVFDFFFIAKSICRWSAFGKILELYSVIRYGFEYGFTYRKICCYTVYFFICFMPCYGNSNFYCWAHR